MCGVICLCDVDVCVRARARRLFAREFLFFNDCHNIFECFGARAFFSNTSPTKWIFRILLIHGVYLWSTRQLIYVEWNNITDKTTQVIVKFLLSFIVLICFFFTFFPRKHSSNGYAERSLYTTTNDVFQINKYLHHLFFLNCYSLNGCKN